MAVPKRKQTPSRTGMRRAQTMKYSTKNIVEDKKSGELRRPHHIDLSTGMYRGKQIIVKKAKKVDETSAQADNTTIEAPDSK